MGKNIMDEKNCRKCDSTGIVMVEYEGMHPNHYDGISEIMCKKCGTRIGRWSGKELQKGETEPRYGEKSQ